MNQYQSHAEPIRALVVDDEKQSRLLVRQLLSRNFAGIDLSEAENIEEGLKIIKDRDPQLVFLDIQLRGQSGFELLDAASHGSFEVVFITAHSEYAIRALRYSALDYLLKPLDTAEFYTAVDRALDKIKNKISIPGKYDLLREMTQGNFVPDRVSIPMAEGALFVFLKDILYCQAAGNYTRFCLADNKKITSSYTLGFYDELLSGRNFFRVSRSFLVNLSHISMYKRNDGGKILMSDGTEIEISRNTKDNLLKILNLRGENR